MSDTWDPETYDRFEAERRLPFDDLLSLVTPCPGGRVVDLGCGTGALTAELHERSGAADTVGIERSAAMLERARAGPGLRFEAGDIGEFTGSGLALMFTNAALQWVPDHQVLLPRLVSTLAPGGQLALQVPANFDHPSHRLANQMASEEPFLSAFGGQPPLDRGDTVLSPEAYAALLDGLGAVELHVRLQVYGHHLASATDVVTWVRGTLLTPFRAGLDDATWVTFLRDYERRLVEELGPAEPYFYTFKRILVRARFP
ncbi:MAG: methyltransferase domain-containing protein [Actinomycetota bacterium]|nr:methyltransferase domain-containing protein [Actinomycetota bacterium]MDQ6945101.1 methyltransferase domain-containing protein [Actinomycetota bacterium]